MERLEIYCDGSGAERVDRPGGWAFVVVRNGEVLVERSGGASKTTALTMELMAASAALTWALDERVEVEVVLISDSRLALEVVAGQRELKRARYVEQAVALRALAVKAKATTKWVRGHSGQVWNERADALAAAAKRRVAPKRSV